MSDVPRSMQSWVSTIHTVVLTADVFQLFIKYKTTSGKNANVTLAHLSTRLVSTHPCHFFFSQVEVDILHGGCLCPCLQNPQTYLAVLFRTEQPSQNSGSPHDGKACRNRLERGVRKTSENLSSYVICFWYRPICPLLTVIFPCLALS